MLLRHMTALMCANTDFPLLTAWQRGDAFEPTAHIL